MCEVGTRHLSSFHEFWCAMRRLLNSAEKCLGDVEVFDSEDGQSRQLETVEFTMTGRTRTEGINQGLPLERPLSSWRLFRTFPLAFVSCWLDMMVG